MELITHALAGAAAGLAMRRSSSLPARHAVGLAVAGAVFPDVDFLGFLVSPLRFLADWHQGPTHSLLLLPAWSLLAGAAYAALPGAGVRRFAAAGLLFAMGLATHIGLDLATAYGTMLFYPASRERFSLDLLYVVDPWFTGMVLLAVLALRRRSDRVVRLACLGAVAAYLALAAAAQMRAMALARTAAPGEFPRIAVFPQPLSPFHWKLIASNGKDHRVAHVNLLDHRLPVPAAAGPLAALADAYRPAADLEWQEHSLRPPTGEPAAALRLWGDGRFAPFRRFATHPALDRTATGHAGCIWFTDLRYDLPALPATFRYGFCPTGEHGAWQLHRLRYFSASGRQRL